MKLKLRAFTLMEIVVAMALSAIVSGIVYTGIRLVGSRFQSHTEQRNLARELELFKLIFNNDLQNSSEALKGNDLQIEMLEKNFQSTIYEFEDELVLRKSKANEIDTFLIKIDDVQLTHLFDREPGTPIRLIQINALINDDPISLNFYKEYAAMDYLKHEENP